jgi:hypothetical protein
MNYILLIYGDPANGQTQTEAEQAAMMGEYFAFTQEIVTSGEMVSGEPLQGIETASTVTVRGGETTVTDGPFAETKECLAGFYMVEERDLDEAIKLASRIPPAQIGSIEVRPIRPVREEPNRK